MDTSPYVYSFQFIIGLEITRNIRATKIVLSYVESVLVSGH